MSFLRACNRALITAFCLLLINSGLFAQSETVPAGHPVYPFLKRMYIEGKLNQYDDIILPLSRSRIKTFLESIPDSLLEIRDSERLIKLKSYFTGEVSSKLDMSYINDDKERHLYTYADSLIKFIVDPLASFKHINSDYNPQAKNATLFIYGGRLKLNYEDYLAFYLQGSNGNQFGSRETALLDRRVAQSYTFNHTKISYFDATEGYVRLEKKHFNLQFGRERVLWGGSHIHRLLLSENPQLFDFVRLNFTYKKLSYDFIHGWLAHHPVFTIFDSLNREVKTKIEKAFAISRLGYRPTDNLSLGISQVVVYSGRAFEAAYLNPFLFWESAQRSLNDFDNSLLAFEGKYRVTRGMEIAAGCIFDDLNFGKYGKGDWAASSNGFGWQASAYLASPLFMRNSSLRIEYMQLRPYIFSHPGLYESLNYTNNGYLLGTDLQPNSTMFSAAFDHDINKSLRVELLYKYVMHGANVYENGKLTKNVGGDVKTGTEWGLPYYTYLLEGELEIMQILNADITYEYSSNLNFNLNMEYRKFPGSNNKNYTNLNASANWALF